MTIGMIVGGILIGTSAVAVGVVSGLSIADRHWDRRIAFGVGICVLTMGVGFWALSH